MAIPGKPNTFFKGMKADVEEALQPKESYRYAKNARVTSHDGDNVSMQPFPSDRLALDFFAEVSAANGVPAMAYTNNWVDLTSIFEDNDADSGVLSTFQTGTLGYILEQQGWNQNTIDPIFYNALISVFETPILGNYTDFNPLSEQNPLTLTITLTENDGNVITISDIDISQGYALTDYLGIPFDVDTLVANAINEFDTNYSATVIHNVNPIGESNDNCNWSFTNTDPSSENYITNITVTAEGEAEVVFYTSNLQGVLSNAEAEDDDEFVVTLANGILQNLIPVFIQIVSDYFEGAGAVTLNETILNEDSVLQDASIFGEAAAQLGFNAEQAGIQVLGTYGFSDYLVILGKWPLLAMMQQEQANDAGEEPTIMCDVIIKVKQSPDGNLNGDGIDGGLGDFITLDDLLGSLFSVYFVGDLQFSSQKKLKVKGSEENEKLRRIYFTDGSFPLKTMNVGLDSLVYSPYAAITEYFNLFSPAKFVPTIVTGFIDGGNLDSISYSYSYRYKTVDGRTSKISPPSNPASVPSTNKNITSSNQKGAESGNTTNKSIEGILENLDSRYAKIEMIYTPYMDGSVAGPSIVFAEYTIPKNGNLAQPLSWVHTGTENPIEEIPIAAFNNNQIKWDTCKAMETKDNRLFCGNLSNSFDDIETDFTVASYNSNNKPHSYGSNPDLYHDLLYSMGGLVFNNGNSTVCNPDNEAAYTKEGNNGDYYRYIQKMENDEPANNAFFSGTILGNANQRRGIFGAESRNFNTPLENGEYEGVRVTFRILSNETQSLTSDGLLPEAVELDSEGKLIQTGDFRSTGTFYNVSAGAADFYNTYANPVYNSNYVGYRRGEIYRFGIVFYDKNGTPMFVKRIGDIRMPEHSAEYIVPNYSATGGNIISFRHAWPYYYQTSRDSKDQGFENLVENNVPYDNQDSKLKGCVLHPYFEVKLSSSTTAKVGGYAIVRVPRDSQNRTILTSGILSKAIKYSDQAGGNDLQGRFGNTTFPLFTEVEQNRKERFNEDKNNIYTIDSPDALVSTGFSLTGGNNRIKLVESAFCQKENIQLKNEDGFVYVGSRKKLPAADLADGDRNPELGNGSIIQGADSNPYTIQEHSISCFAAVLQNELLDGGEVINPEWEGGQNEDVGGWLYQFSEDSYFNEDLNNETGFGLIQDTIDNDGPGTFDWPPNQLLFDENLEYQTKYYSKRISCYPQYALAQTELTHLWVNNNQPFNINSQQRCSNLPFTSLSDSNRPTAPSNYNFFETNIIFNKVVMPGEEVTKTELNSEHHYRNGHFFHELWGMQNEQFNLEQKWQNESGGDELPDAAKYSENCKTIVCSVDNESPGMMPILRQHISGNNYPEGVNSRLGWSPDHTGAGHWSPETTIASIHKKQSHATMYGGNSIGSFSKNIFQLTGHFQPVSPENIGVIQNNVGDKGNHVFGGDTYIGYHTYKKSLREKVDASYAVFFGQIVPLECDFNLNLRHGLYFGNNTSSIPRYISDDNFYNSDFDSENNGLVYVTEPLDWDGVNEWPSTIAWSEQKFTGDVTDNYSIFPINQIKDLDYNRGPITQMFDLNDKLFALQHSGTCLLSVNPRVLIPTKEGASIEAVTGSGKAVERYDYLSNFGSQHFHGLAVSDSSAYYYDDNNCKFLRLGRGKGGGFGVISLGEMGLMQSYFNSFKNSIINDLPLTNLLINEPASSNYNENIIDSYESIESGIGGISLGYDPEFSEILLTIMAENQQPRTIVYNENLQSFTSFISKIPADYFNYNGRLYSTYNVQEGNDNDALTSLNKVYLANGEGVGPQNNYLTFAGIDYYIWDFVQQEEDGEPVFIQNAGIDGILNTEDDTQVPVMEDVYKEPFELEFSFNDSPVESKIFDKIQLSMNSDTEAGYRYNYFRKFVFKGAANIRGISQFDDGSNGFASTDSLLNSSKITWYSIKDGFHFIPMRTMHGPYGPQGKVRGNYATARLTMGWAEDDSHPSGADIKIKNEKFNIFSVVPFYRASRV